MNPSGWTTGRFKLSRLLGELGFKFCWRHVAKGRVQPLGNVDLLNEPARVFGHVRLPDQNGRSGRSLSLAKLANPDQRSEAGPLDISKGAAHNTTPRAKGYYTRQRCQHDLNQTVSAEPGAVSILASLKWQKHLCFVETGLHSFGRL